MHGNRLALKHPDQFGQAIRAELSGSDTATALNITTQSPSPVLALCRRLIEAGHDPATPLKAYRGDMLCLRVWSIGQGAQLRMATDSIGRPVFKAEESRAAAPPVRQNRRAAG